MTRRATIPYLPNTPMRTHNRKLLLGAPASTYLVLVAWLGIHAATGRIPFAAFIWVWFSACRRWPVFGILSVAFVGGIISGLIGGRRR